MDTSYKFSYPCKTISNFYDNFYGYHIYDEIKEITYRKKKVSENEIEIYDYFQLFQIIYSLPIESNWEEYKTKYQTIFGVRPSSEYDDLVSKIKSDFYGGIFIFARMTKKNLKETFLAYLYIQNMVSKHNGYSILLPANLRLECDTILDEEIGRYFLKGWFNMLYKPQKYDLRERIIERYKNNKKNLLLKMVEEIYLFGSIYKNEYHDSSDIDIVIKFKDNVSLEDVVKTKQYYLEFNKNNFGRDTDIQDYYDYIQLHDIEKTIRLI